MACCWSELAECCRSWRVPLTCLETWLREPSSDPHGVPSQGELACSLRDGRVSIKKQKREALLQVCFKFATAALANEVPLLRPGSDREGPEGLGPDGGECKSEPLVCSVCLSKSWLSQDLHWILQIPRCVLSCLDAPVLKIRAKSRKTLYTSEDFASVKTFSPT